MRESIPQMKPTVYIKPKNGCPGYMREDPRLKEALKAFRHKIRSQTPMDENINKNFAPFPKKEPEDIKYVQINSDRSDEEIEQDPNPTISKKVSFSNFIVRP